MNSNRWNVAKDAVIDQELTTSINWIDFAHIILRILTLTNLLYIIIIRNYVNKKPNILTNLYSFTLIGQLVACFGYQLSHLYYQYMNMTLAIFTISICQNIALAILSFSIIMIALVYHLLITKDYSKMYKLFYGSYRWCVVLGYLLLVTTWMISCCYHWIFSRIFFVVFVEGGLILYSIYYCRLGGYSYCWCTCCCEYNPDYPIRTLTKNPFVGKTLVDPSNRRYKIGLFGSVLFGATIMIVPIFEVIFDENVILKLILDISLIISVGLCYCAIHIGVDYIASSKISQNIAEKALAMQVANIIDIDSSQSNPKISIHIHPCGTSNTREDCSIADPNSTAVVYQETKGENDEGCLQKGHGVH